MLEAKTAEQMVRFLVNQLGGRDGRIALFEPCPREYTATIEKMAGVAYVDCGRNYSWNCRLDALRKVLLDGVKCVLVAQPNFPTGTREPIESLLHVLEENPRATLVLDQRWEWVSVAYCDHPQVLQWTGSAHELPSRLRGSSLEGFERPLPDGLRWLDGSELPLQNPGYESARSELPRSVLEGDFRISNRNAPFALIQKTGMDSAKVTMILESMGIESFFRPSHTWRGGVCVGYTGRRHESG